MANPLENNLEPLIRGRYLDLARIKIQVHCHSDPISFSSLDQDLWAWCWDLLLSPFTWWHLSSFPKDLHPSMIWPRAPGPLQNSLNGPRLSQGWAPTPRLLGGRRRGCLFNIHFPHFPGPLDNLKALAQEYIDVQNLCKVLPSLFLIEGDLASKGASPSPIWKIFAPLGPLNLNSSKNPACNVLCKRPWEQPVQKCTPGFKAAWQQPSFKVCTQQ